MSGGISRRTLVIIAAIALVVVGVGAFMAGRASSPSATDVETSLAQGARSESSGAPLETDGLGRPQTTNTTTSLPNASAGSAAEAPAVPATSLTDTTLPAGCEAVGPHDDIALSDLPAEAFDTLTIIANGPPYPYRADGSVFQNREGHLPDRERGYYHEYTVETPGSSDRGARRIVTGECGELWYTSDHYDSFELIDVNR